MIGEACRLFIQSLRLQRESQLPIGSHSFIKLGKTSLFTFCFSIFVLIFLARYFLITEHSAHIALAVPYLPWLLFLACPLMHLFMHGGSHGHRD